MPRSPLVLAALELREQLRAEYALTMEALYADAERECSGQLVNARGRARGVDGWQLLTRHNRWMLDAYATRELRDWLERVKPQTFAQYEAARAAELLQHFAS